MRSLVRFTLPTDASNAALRNGSMQKVLRAFLDEWKPEAAYFCADEGRRSGLFVIDLKEASQIPALLEPLWLAMGADITCVPVMNLDDFMKAMPSIEAAVKAYP